MFLGDAPNSSRRFVSSSMEIDERARQSYLN